MIDSASGWVRQACPPTPALRWLGLALLLALPGSLLILPLVALWRRRALAMPGISPGGGS